jgi:hypothetical protein
MRKILILLCLPTVVLLDGCKKTLPSNGGTAVQNMSNGWWVNYYVGGVAQLPKPVFYETYNTASNTSDSMWINDLGLFWNFKGVVVVNYKALTFSNSLSINAYYADTAKIANGKILPKAGHSKAGNITDSIYLEIQFSDDSPAYGNTYIVRGTARTGFIEDDY